VGKQFFLYACNLVLIIRHAKHIRRIAVYGQLLPAPLNNIFQNNLTNGTILDIKTEHEICILRFSTILSETFLILRRVE
jgi:hypothetical protein